MKRVFLRLFWLVLLLGILAVSACAESGSCGENLTWDFNSSTGTLTISGTGAMEDYAGSYYNHSPWYYKTVKKLVINSGVTHIGSYAFMNFDSCISFSLPSTVTSIGSGAFQGSAALQTIILPTGLETIGNYAFQDTNLYSINIPSTVTTIGSSAFAYCPLLASVIIPDSVTTMGASVFSNCPKLVDAGPSSSYDIWYKWTTAIPDNAFSHCTSLTDVEFPSTLTAIGNSAFRNTGLTQVSLPGYVATLGEKAFYGCKTLYHLTFNLKLETIGKEAFSSCSALTHISWPTALEVIEAKAFYNCSSLPSLTLPSQLLTIGESAFYGCTGLTSVTVPYSLTKVSGSAFQSCTSLIAVYSNDMAAWCGIDFGNDTANPLYYAKKLYLGGKLVRTPVLPEDTAIIGSYAFINCEDLQSITIPEGVTSIGWKAFAGSGLTALHLPASVTAIGGSWTSTGSNWFSEVTELTELTVAEDSKTFSAVDNILYNKEQTVLLCCPAGRTADVTAIPATVTEIAQVAFVNCTGISRVELPAGVTTIDRNAFRGCAGLTDVVLSDSLQTIGESAFYECTGLTAVELPEGAQTIGSSAFRGCTALKTVTLPEGLQTIGSSAFRNTALTEIYIPASVTSVGHEYVSCATFAQCPNLTAIEVSEDNEYLCDVDGVLMNKEQTLLISYPGGKPGGYIIPDTLTEIRAEAFYGAQGLTGISIPATITYEVWCGGWELSFSNCTNLEKIEFWGDCPLVDPINGWMGTDFFYHVTATVWYPAGNTTWDGNLYDYGGNLTYVPFTPSHSYSVVDEVKGDCTTDGELRSLCATCNHLKTEITEAPGHDMTHVAGEEGDCTTDTVLEHWICGNCGNTYLDEDGLTPAEEVILPAPGHTYTEEFIWAEDYSTCDLLLACGCGEEQELYCTVTHSITQPTCTKAGKAVYTAVLVYDGVSYSDTVEVTMEKLGHSYEAEFVWSEDHSACTANFTCIRDCGSSTSLSCRVTVETVEAGYLTAGYVRYTAAVKYNKVEYTDTYTKLLQPTVQIARDGQRITVTGLPEGVYAMLVGYDANGKQVSIAIRQGSAITVTLPAEAVQGKVFLTDAAFNPLCESWKDPQ